ncbi:MAG TPA: hypothetical protein VE616_09740 [Candidatus Udaeobacter sp.]|jgi:hypothetical protein|nr:hypothetical protein [Candidatus Udaeobacter sp.]
MINRITLPIAHDLNYKRFLSPPPGVAWNLVVSRPEALQKFLPAEIAR